MTRRPIGLSICAGIALFASSALAAEPSKQECVAANESGQDLQRMGKLREARATLAICTAASCPGAVREDCGQRLKEVESAIPRLVFAAKDAAGHDLIAVRVTMDGETLLEKLDGSATLVDPGEHHFTFEADGYRKNESTLLVREGELDRPVRVVLESNSAAAAGQVAEFDGTRRALGITFGIVGLGGLAAGTVFGLLAKSTYDTSVNECHGVITPCPSYVPLATQSQAQEDHNSAVNEALVSTVAFIAGGVLVAAGAVIYLTAPEVTTGEVAVAPTITREGGGFVLRGKW
jgi:hypothetical protein